MYKISVIIPMYNDEKYLRNCIDHVVEQSIGFDNIKLILIDDNSKDKSKCISGQFIVQKKSKNDTWDNYNTLPLNKLAMGQWINLYLSTSSMETLLIEYIIKNY